MKPDLSWLATKKRELIRWKTLILPLADFGLLAERDESRPLWIKVTIKFLSKLRKRVKLRRGRPTFK